MSDYICRKATVSDDAATIAKYIHLTDPYIYPNICKDPADPMWIAFIKECLRTQDNIFNLDNISVILSEERIVGIACVIPCGKNLNFAESIRTTEAFQGKLQAAIAGYFAPLIAESKDFIGYNLTNFCIDAQHRGKGVGSLFLSYCTKEYGNLPIHLDVIASNEPAVRLYKKAGFRIENNYLGFSGSGTDLPCYHMLYTSKTAE